MDLRSTKSHSTIGTPPATSLSAKIRRLKIEESLLLQSIKKCIPECSQTDNVVDTNHNIFSEFKTFSTRTKTSYKQIKLIFEDIKTSTSSKELLKSLDIDDVKKSTLELENTIKSFKSRLQSELATLKSAEKQLNESLMDNPLAICKLKKRPRVQTAKYNEIVPSPVKILMTSPFKCSEVQQFQEFMMNSGNRYGGWNQYHHNIFVNCWQKHFGSETNTSTNCDLPHSTDFNLFLRDLLPRLHGVSNREDEDVSEDEVLSHVEWYLKYLYLKECQQKAIDKWRRNRQMMKSSKTEPKLNENYKNKSEKEKSRVTKSEHSDLNNIVSDELKLYLEDSLPTSPNQEQETSCFIRKCLCDEIVMDGECFKNINLTQHEISTFSENTEQETSLHFQKSTKQWNLKVTSKNDKTERNLNNNLNDIQKL